MSHCLEITSTLAELKPRKRHVLECFGMFQEIDRVANFSACTSVAPQETTKDSMGIAQTRGPVTTVSVNCITGGERSSHGPCSGKKYFPRLSVPVSRMDQAGSMDAEESLEGRLLRNTNESLYLNLSVGTQALQKLSVSFKLSRAHCWFTHAMSLSLSVLQLLPVQQQEPGWKHRQGQKQGDQNSTLCRVCTC